MVDYQFKNQAVLQKYHNRSVESQIRTFIMRTDVTEGKKSAVRNPFLFVSSVSHN